MRLLIICYHFPHFSEVKWPRATKEDCGRLENKTQISWLPDLSLCLFPEQPLGRQQSLVNYFVFIRVGIIVPFPPPLSQDYISPLVLNTDPSLHYLSTWALNAFYSVSGTSVWQSQFCRHEIHTEKLICAVMQSLRWILEPHWDLPRQCLSYLPIISL